MPRRNGLDAPASFARHQVSTSSALRSYSSKAEGKTVVPCAINQKTPAKQTAVSKKKCSPNHATSIRFQYINERCRRGDDGCAKRTRVGRQFGTQDSQPRSRGLAPCSEAEQQS